MSAHPTVPAPPRGTLRRALRLTMPGGSSGAGLVASVLLGVGAAAAAVALTATSGWLIARAAERPHLDELALAVLAVRFLGISRGLLRYGERVVGHDAALRALADVRLTVYRRLERLAPSGLAAFRDGDLLHRLVDDVDSLQDLPLRVVSPYTSTLLVGAATAGFVGWRLPEAGVVLLVALVLAVTVVPLLTVRTAQQGNARTAGARSDLTDEMVDLLEGAPELAVLGATDAQLARVARADAHLTAAAARSALTDGLAAAVSGLLTGAAVVAVLVVGGLAAGDGRISLVQLTVIVLATMAVMQLVSELWQPAAALVTARAAAERVLAVLDAPDPVEEPAAPLPVPEPPVPVRLSAVSAAYGAHRDPALTGVDLSLGAGERLGLVGPSGAGKSTVAAVLLRFLAPEEGQLTLAGSPAERHAGDDVRRRIGLAAQDAHVFDGTLGENLRIARPDATDAELREVLDAVRLLVWTDGLAEGLGTRVGLDGARLSGGQRQRLVVARALLADFEVLVLDEPGEHLDLLTADAMTDAVLRQTGPAAVLVITHRLHGLGGTDRVLVLQGGRVVEQGRHLDLVGRDGAYAALWARERGLDLTMQG